MHSQPNKRVLCCTGKFVHEGMHVCMYVCTYVCMYVCMVWMNECKRVRGCTHVRVLYNMVCTQPFIHLITVAQVIDSQLKVPRTIYTYIYIHT